MNPTATKFGYPETLVAETAHWWILARPRQVTLGSLVLVCREAETSFGAVSAAGFADLQGVIANAERVLKGFVDYERINYLMLMMVDPDVHFHVIPRYQGARVFGDLAIADSAWPGPPQLGEAVAVEPDKLQRLTAELKRRW